MLDKVSFSEIASLAITLVTVISYITTQIFTIKDLKKKVDHHEETISKLSHQIIRLPEAESVDTLEDALHDALKDQNGLLTGVIKDIANMVKRESLEELNIKIEQLDKQRNKDVLDFTNVLSQFNSTLTKLDTTMGHFNTTLNEIKSTIKDHETELKSITLRIK